jgi:hypothetical protein
VSIVPVDTPDGQYGTVSPQLLLGTFANTSLVEVIALPPNAETLLLFSVGGTNMTVKSIFGVTTGQNYNVSQLPGVSPTVESGVFVTSVMPTADAQVTVTWTGGGLGNWYAVADSAVRQYFDETIAQVIGLVGGGAPSSALLVAGEYSGGLQPLQVAPNGGLLPFVPTATVQTTVGGGLLTILPAPTSGGNYIFRIDAWANAAGDILLSAGAMSLPNIGWNAGVGNGIDFKGFRTTGVVQCVSSLAGTQVTVTYAPGP